MDADTLRREILAFDPEIPIERAWSPPSSWYTTAAVHDLERTAVWARTWQYAAMAHEVAKPGDFVAVDIADQPLVVVRGQDGVLRAFHNVCRHRAAVVCHGAGNHSELVCPYHGWRYHLNGALKSAPKMAGIQDFDRAAMSLPPLLVEEWGHWVFINADLDATPFREEFGALDAALERTNWRDLVYKGRKESIIGCNWKAFCDNYLDGGYHIPHMHPSLDAQLGMEGYRTELFGRYNVQSAPASSEAEPDFHMDVSQRIGDGALYAWLYPNFMFNRYGATLDINCVRPTAPEECVVIFDWWFDPTVDEDFVEQSKAQTDVTQLEDIAISHMVQRGLRSEQYTKGRYAPQLEIGAHHFHQLLSADLRAGLKR